MNGTRKILRVGLTGGIGSGKTEVGKIFADLGAFLIDSDALAREAVKSGSAALAAIGRRWPKVVRADGSLDRPALAQVVFSDAGARAFVNGIVHPYVHARRAALEKRAAAHTVVVHDVPLLFENGYQNECDVTIVVIAPVETRIARVMARTGLTRAQVEARLPAQIEPERARELADIVIENDGTIEELRERATSIYHELAARIEA